MSKFYGQVSNGTAAAATRTGAREIQTAAQSWDGSVITRLSYFNGALRVEVETADGSSARGSLIFSGTLDEFKRRLAEG